MQTEVVWRMAAAARRAPDDLRQQARPRAGRASSAPSTSCATRFGAGRRAARAAHRRGGRRSAASPTCSPTPPTSTTAAWHRTADDPRRAWRSSSTRSTTPSSRASSSPTTTSSSATSTATCRRVEELEHALAHGVADGERVPGGVRLGHRRGRHRPAGRLHRARSARRPLDRPPSTVAGRRHRRSRSPPTPTASRSPSCSRRSPTPTSARSRCSRCCRARSSPTTTSSTAAPAPTSACTACSPLRGKEQEPVDARCRPATSPRVAKLGDTAHRRHARARRARRCTCRADRAARAGARRSPSSPKTQADEDKLATALHRLQDEDPALVVERDDETHQTLLRGMGETHLAIALERLERKFGVERRAPRTCGSPYRETITEHGRGRGQVQEADRRPRPVRRRASCGSSRSSGATGFEFVDKIVGGAIPPAVHPRGARRASRRRWPTAACYGFPVVDVRVDAASTASTTRVDCSEMSFKMAGSLGFKEAMAKAGPVAARADLAARGHRARPTYQGDVMGDLNARRGRVQGTEPGDGGEQAIIALVPDVASSCATPSTCARSPAAGAASPPRTTTTTCCPRTSSTPSAETSPDED